MLGSRQQMCVHKDISQMTGVAQNLACRTAVASRSCQHYRQVETYLREDPAIGTEPVDIEDLVQLGKGSGGKGGGCGPCPYFLSREMAKVCGEPGAAQLPALAAN